MKSSFLANLALMTTVFLWSVHVVVARITVQNLPPFTIHFFRMLTAFLAFSPFFLRSKCWKKKEFIKLIAVALLASVNMTFFIWGIQYTTASASQLIYAVMPILMIFAGTAFLKKKYSLNKILGVVLGFAGIIYIIYLSSVEKGETISGNLIGNLAITVGMMAWFCYILFSKKLSKYFSPIVLGSVSILVSLTTSIPLLVWERGGLNMPLSLTFLQVLALLFMGVGGTFLTYILYQYAIKYSSPLKASLTSYVQPITTAFLAVIFLGERLNTGFVLGSLTVFLGIFLTTTLEFMQKKGS